MGPFCAPRRRWKYRTRLQVATSELPVKRRAHRAGARVSWSPHGLGRFRSHWSGPGHYGCVPLFEINKHTKDVAEISPTNFPALRLWERQDFESWVLSAPELAGGDFTVLTSEYDRFDRTSERLDVLGIVQTDPGRGR